MKAVSLFSGVGGFDLGLERAGIETILQAEIDPWCREVLARHWPGVRRVNDVRVVGRGECSIRSSPPASDGHIDIKRGERAIGHAELGLVYGGFPCQPFSVAGKRGGDRDERNLWPEFRRVVRELRPTWVLAENVPGLLSFDDGRFFGSILDDLGELGFAGVAYAVLDARFFGVAQRRRRVFIVGGPTRRSAEQVLSLCESCGGNPEQGRAAGERVAATIRGRSAGPGNNMPGRGGEDDANLITAYNIQSNDGGEHKRKDRPEGGFYVQETDGHLLAGQYWNGSDVADTLDVSALVKRQTMPDKGRFAAVLQNGVRRLTPLECERLQGWPDDHTRWTADGREISDSVRYRMIGNGVVAPVAEWIGRRIVAMGKARLAAGLGGAE